MSNQHPPPFLRRQAFLLRRAYGGQDGGQVGHPPSPKRYGGQAPSPEGTSAAEAAAWFPSREGSRDLPRRRLGEGGSAGVCSLAFGDYANIDPDRSCSRRFSNPDLEQKQTKGTKSPWSPCLSFPLLPSVQIDWCRPLACSPLASCGLEPRCELTVLGAPALRRLRWEGGMYSSSHDSRFAPGPPSR